jgi:hypothetical protein
MKLIANIMMVSAAILSSVSSFAQNRKATTETVKISGNCDMCKATIEKAGNVKKLAAVAWDKDTKTAILAYDSQKTSSDEILKRIALAGYDNERFLAPAEAYAKLPGCCQYERVLKPAAKPAADPHSHQETTPSANDQAQQVSPLKAVTDTYFSVKDALVKTDAGAASSKAGELLKAINAVDMAKLPAQEHAAWMSVLKDLKANAEKLSHARDISKQREAFALLSENMYALVKASKPEATLYYQHCPMYNNGKGANWLSRDSAVKNPFYGSKMLTCGSTVETISNK